MDKYRKMTKKDALKYCWENEENFINDVGYGGKEQFDCLIMLLEDDVISPVDLPSHGMDY